MQTTNNKKYIIPFHTETKMSVDEWNFIINNNGGNVTSCINNTKNSLNSEKFAFAPMSNKSLRNRYATTGL